MTGLRAGFHCLAIALLVLACGCATKREAAKHVSIEEDSQRPGRTAQAVEAELSGESGKAGAGSRPAVKAVSEKDCRVERVSAEEFRFESSGEGLASKYEPQVEAEKRAEQDALAKVVRQTGVNVYYGVTRIDEESGKTSRDYIGRYINTWFTTLAEYDRTGEPVYEPVASGVRCRLALKGKMHLKGDPDPNFQLICEMDKPVYYAGDDISLKIKPTKDCYVAVVSVDQEGKAFLLYPNPESPSVAVKGGEEFKIPGDMPFSLQAFLPEGRETTSEIMHVVASRGQPLFIPEETREKREGAFMLLSVGGLTHVSRKLAKFKRSDWTMQVLMYTISLKTEKGGG